MTDRETLRALLAEIKQRSREVDAGEWSGPALIDAWERFSAAAYDALPGLLDALDAAESDIDERDAVAAGLGKTAEAQAAEVRRLREHEAVLVGLLEEARPFVRATRLAGSRLDLGDRIDALTGGSDG